MGEAEHVCCASSTSKSTAHPDPNPIHACSGSAQQGPPDCEEKRDPRRNHPAETIKPELDPATRLEKRTLAPLRKKDVGLTKVRERPRCPRPLPTEAVWNTVGGPAASEYLVVAGARLRPGVLR